MFTTDTKAKIIEFIRQNGSATNKQLRPVLGISKVGISQHLGDLKGRGTLFRSKEGTYYLSPEYAKTLTSAPLKAGSATARPLGAQMALYGASANTLTVGSKALTPAPSADGGRPPVSSGTAATEGGRTPVPVATVPADGARPPVSVAIGAAQYKPRTSRQKVDLRGSTGPAALGANGIAAKTLTPTDTGADTTVKILTLATAEIKRLKVMVQDTTTELKGLKTLMAHMNADLEGLQATMTTFQAIPQTPATPGVAGEPPTASTPPPLLPVQPKPVQVTATSQQTIVHPQRLPQAPVAVWLHGLAGFAILGFIGYWLLRGLVAVVGFIFGIIDWLFIHGRGI